MEVYESHLGGIYFESRVLEYRGLYCDQCGDTDWHLGHVETWDDVIDLITEIDENCKPWCPYHEEYLEELKAEFEAIKVTDSPSI